MIKFVVASLLVLGCSATPESYTHGTTTTYEGKVVKPTFSKATIANPVQWIQSTIAQPAHYSYARPAQYTIAQPAHYSYARPAQYTIAQPAHYSYAQPAQFVVAQPAVSTVVAARPSYSVVQSGLATGFLGGNYGLNYGYQQKNVVAQKNVAFLDAGNRVSHQFESVVPAAVQQVSRTVEYKALPHVEQPIQHQVIEVEPSDNPVHLHFKTRSSTLSLSQSHTPAAAQEVQTAQASDEPARLITEVQKPVVQEVREVITPYRQVTQEINPVVESLHTVVTKGEARREQYVAKENIAPVSTTYSTQAVAAPVESHYSVAQVAPVSTTYSTQAVAAPVESHYSVAPVAVQAYQPAVQTVAAPVESHYSVARVAPVSVQTIAAPVVATQTFASPSTHGYTTSSVAKHQTVQSGVSGSKPVLDFIMNNQ
ncbi:hypothetical protein BLOT_003992 [Blomia tropicalis]|nr:hypothetical protein BLOT_003992 [Blomia tropicalis]